MPSTAAGGALLCNTDNKQIRQDKRYAQLIGLRSGEVLKTCKNVDAKLEGDAYVTRKQRY